MSRICVKGIPRECTEQQLRNHIGNVIGDITDVKIARTKDGRSRQFAFVGFKAGDAADKAIKHFNKSFFGACRLAVEPAKEIGDDSVLQRAWSKHTQKPAAPAQPVEKPETRKRQREETDVNNAAEKLFAELGIGKAARKLAVASGIKDPAKLREFLATVAPRSNAPTWANDDAEARQKVVDARKAAKGGPAAATDASSKPISSRGRSAAQDGDDDGASTDSEEYQEIRGDNAGSKAKKAKIAANDSDDDMVSDDGEDSADVKSAKRSRAEAGSQPGTGMSDLDYLRSKKSAKAFDDDSDDDMADNDEDDEDWGSDDSGEDEDGVAGRKARAARQRSAVSGGAKAKKGKASGADDAADAAADADGAGDDAGANCATAESQEEDLAESGRLFVRNLPFSATDDEVKQHFSSYGPIAEVLVVRDVAGRGKGYGYVTYVIPEHAVLALPATDGKVFQGRLLHVLPAKAAPAKETVRGGEDAEGGRSSFKSAREEKRRAGAGSEREATSIWNTLFVRTDAAVAAAAAALGVSKSELLDRDAKNTAVRAAIAEASVIAETKKFLISEGVVLDTLEKALEAGAGTALAVPARQPGGNTTSAAGKRSDTVILVKNLPPDADTDALRELFSRHGLLARFVLPPAKVIALVEYTEPRAAKRAFGALAYARFQRVPLYLEWAPEATFSSPAPAPAPVAAPAPAPAAAPTASDKSKDGKGEAKDKKKDKDATGPTAAGTAAAAAASEPVDAAGGSGGLPTDGRTIFVKNLSFATSEEGLKDVASRAGPVRAVRIPKRKNPKFVAGKSSSGVSEWLSMGYGFVEYGRKEDADTAIRTLQGTMLDEHALQLKVSTASGAGAASSASAAASAPAKKSSAPVAVDSNSTKLMVRNLAFEANKNELQELFQAYGTLRSVRIPRKMDGTGRGFAFVEYLTHDEAVAAKAALGAAHLYGRHLVIEWAAADSNAAGVGAGPAASGASSASAGAGAGAGAGAAPEAVVKADASSKDPRARAKAGALKLVKAPEGKKMTFD